MEDRYLGLHNWRLWLHTYKKWVNTCRIICNTIIIFISWDVKSKTLSIQSLSLTKLTLLLESIHSETGITQRLNICNYILLTYKGLLAFTKIQALNSNKSWLLRQHYLFSFTLMRFDQIKHGNHKQHFCFLAMYYQITFRLSSP